MVMHAEHSNLPNHGFVYERGIPVTEPCQHCILSSPTVDSPLHTSPLLPPPSALPPLLPADRHPD
jgi:hypothetical protein